MNRDTLTLGSAENGALPEFAAPIVDGINTGVSNDTSGVVFVEVSQCKLAMRRAIDRSFNALLLHRAQHCGLLWTFDFNGSPPKSWGANGSV